MIMTIGIYGGSFDPIHSGHAMVANFVSQCNVVDEVWIMVGRRNPMKMNYTLASDSHRLKMAEIVAEKCEKVSVSDLEMSMPLPSYSIHTLYKLKELYPQHDFKFIIGSDSLQNFDKWKESERIRKEFGLIVYPRPGYPLPQVEPDGMKFLSGAPEFSMSSSLIREYVASGWNINYFVPIKVAEYILKNHLYQ